MALIDVFNLAVDSGFQQRIRAAIAQTASAVLTEDPTTPNHAARVAKALQIGQAPDPWVAMAAFVLAGTPNMAPDNDAMISAGVANLFAAYAAS